MTVKELIDVLSGCREDAKVVLPGVQPGQNVDYQFIVITVPLHKTEDGFVLAQPEHGWPDEWGVFIR